MMGKAAISSCRDRKERFRMCRITNDYHENEALQEERKGPEDSVATAPATWRTLDMLHGALSGKSTRDECTKKLKGRSMDARDKAQLSSVWTKSKPSSATEVGTFGGRREQFHLEEKYFAYTRFMYFIMTILYILLLVTSNIFLVNRQAVQHSI